MQGGTTGGERMASGARRRLAAAAAALVLWSVAACGGGAGSGAAGSDDLVREPDQLTGAIEEIAGAVGGEAVRARDVLVYPEYAIVEAQDPAAPDHIDRYTWRGGEVGDAEPVHLTGPQEEVDLELFPLSAVSWADLHELVAEAEDRLEAAEPVAVEEPRAGYVSIGRSSSDDRPLTLTVYVEGPRRSGYVEFSARGDVLTTNVS